MGSGDVQITHAHDAGLATREEAPVSGPAARRVKPALSSYIGNHNSSLRAEETATVSLKRSITTSIKAGRSGTLLADEPNESMRSAQAFPRGLLKTLLHEFLRGSI